MKTTIQIAGNDKDQIHIEANALIEHMRDRGYAWVGGGMNVVTSRGNQYYMVIDFKPFKLGEKVK